jgi:hypothetical protein
VAEVLLFHHALGLTAGVVAFAERLRAAGHVVHTPDLFEGRTFSSVADGVGYAEQVGFDTIAERGRRAADGLPAPIVPAGFSLGVIPAQTFMALAGRPWMDETHWSPPVDAGRRHCCCEREAQTGAGAARHPGLSLRARVSDSVVTWLLGRSCGRRTRPQGGAVWR